MGRMMHKRVAVLAVLCIFMLVCCADIAGIFGGSAEETVEPTTTAFFAESVATELPEEAADTPEPSDTAEPTGEPTSEPSEEPTPTIEATEAPVDSITPAPEVTPELTEGPEFTEEYTEDPTSGYAMAQESAPVWLDCSFEAKLGNISEDAGVWVCTASAENNICEVMFDTDMTTETDECHIAYMQYSDIVWIGEAYHTAVVQTLKAQNARVVNGITVPNVAFEYSELYLASFATPEATVTADPEYTAEPEQSAEADYAEETEPTTEPTAEPTAEPENTIEPDSTEAPLATPEAQPTVEAEATVEPGTDEGGDELMPTVVPECTLSPEAEEIIRAENMRADLDETHPYRQAYVYSSCDADTFAPGNEVTLEAMVVGYDGIDYRIIWEVDRGNGWENAGVDGETTITFEITDENLVWNWRIGVSMPYADIEE